MKLVEVRPQPNWTLSIIADDGSIGVFDVRPYLNNEAFEELQDPREFAKVTNGGYFVEWACGADLSTDTLEARWQVVGKVVTTANSRIPDQGLQQNRRQWSAA